MTAAEIDELDGTGAADALAETLTKIIAAEADQFRLAAHWADLHAPDFVDDCLSILPGMSRSVRAGADGTGEMDEFAAAELAALLGISTGAGEQYVADAVNVRHRHPLLWARICDGTARVWVARKVARRCAAEELAEKQAQWVDAETTPYVNTLPPGRFFALVEAKIAAADPAAAAARAQEEALRRFARAGRVDEHGMRTFVARAAAGDVTYLVAVLNRIAGVLALRGDTDPVEARMATGLRILANPARALQLLTEATLDAITDQPSDQPSDRASDPPSDPPTEDAESRRGGSECGEDLPEAMGTPEESVSWMLDARGRSLPGVPLRRDLQPLTEQSPGRQTADGLLPGLGGGQQPPGDAEQPAGGTIADGVCGVGGLEEALDPELFREVLRALAGFDATRLDPVTVIQVHVSSDALESDQGVARVEDVGPMTLEAARRWLVERPGELHLRPVIDARALAPVDRYEFTPLMRELVACRLPHEVFPYGTLPTRRTDHDHIHPYEPDGPPGQTSLDNCAPLSRRHHRLKTFGHWILRITESCVFWWRSPHGHWFRVDHDGTHRHGRSAELDERFLEQTARGDCSP